MQTRTHRLAWCQTGSWIYATNDTLQQIALASASLTNHASMCLVCGSVCLKNNQLQTFIITSDHGGEYCLVLDGINYALSARGMDDSMR